MTPSAITIRKKLHLDHLKYIRIARLLVSNVKIYMVFYDSRFPNTPLTSTQIYSKPMPTMFYTHPFSSSPQIAPDVNLDDFTGMIENSVFCCIDMSGNYGNKDIRARLSEITFPELKQSAISSINKKYLKIRKADGETGTYLVSSDWNDKEDILELDWQVTPTYTGNVLNYDPNLDTYKDSKYRIITQFLDVSKILKSKSDFKKLSPKEQGNRILDILNNCDILVWASDPSFYLQGSFEDLAQIGASVFPYNGPKGKGIWNQRHGGLHLTKHIAEMGQVINANYADIAKAIRGNL